MVELDGSHLTGEFPVVPKQQRAQQKRNALLESGLVLFKEKGYEHTTAKEIASHAGVAVGTFYRYFSDKRQLLMSLLEDKIENIIPPVPNWLNVNPEQFLSQLLKEHFESLDELKIQKVLPELLPYDEEFAQFLFETKRKLHNRICMSLNEVKEKGFLWEDIDIDTVAWIVLSIFEKLPDKQKESGTEPDYDKIAKGICRMVFPPEKLKLLQKNE